MKKRKKGLDAYLKRMQGQDRLYRSGTQKLMPRSCYREFRLN